MKTPGSSIFRFKPPRITAGWTKTDILASYRTILANERTVLAYIRTALTLFVAGLTFIRFFESFVIELIGWIFIPLAIATLAIGIFRYNREKYQIHFLSHRKSEADNSGKGEGHTGF